MPDQLKQRVEACYLQAETFFQRRFARPEIRLDLRGQKAGVAYLQRNLLRFNRQLYLENAAHFLQQTVAHEVAHLIAHQLYGPAIRPHGEQWQAIMRGVYELPADRCHTYRITQKPRQRYIYRCQCPGQEFSFTAQRHALVRKGRRYLCRSCRATLEHTGLQRLE